MQNTVMYAFLQIKDGETFINIAGSKVTRCVDVMLVYIFNADNKVAKVPMSG